MDTYTIASSARSLQENNAHLAANLAAHTIVAIHCITNACNQEKS